METPAHIAVEVRRLTGAPVLAWSDIAAPASGALADVEWNRITQANPRVHDGPLALVSAVGADGTIRAHRGTYRGFVTAPAAGIAAEALGVSGVLRHRQKDGTFLTLIGKRGRQTRVYGGLWETAPRGTVPPPPLGVQLTSRSLEEQLRTELKEEVGVEVAATHVSPYALVRDPAARSLDVVYAMGVDGRGYEQIDAAARKGGNWEYAQLRWVNLEADGPKMMDELSPPTAALVRAIQSWT